MALTLAACAEMLWLDKPIEWRCTKLDEKGFQVSLWNWSDHDLGKLEKSGASFSIMNGYLEGRLADDEGPTSCWHRRARRPRWANASVSPG